MERCGCSARWRLPISELRVIDFARNHGQTVTLMAGLDYAQGGIIVPIDAEQQNDPADIPLLLAEMAEAYDVVSSGGAALSGLFSPYVT
jgi:glycosyltransferase involved in cell wall biosynthesis